MNKKLIAVAVAGMFVAPAAALAQSSVTISGLMKISMGSLKLSNSAKTPASETRITDDSSRIVFNVVEDLGGGLQAIAQVDWRVALDNGVDGTPAGGFGAGGNNHVGLRSSSWGRIIFGRQDLHYFNRESDLTTKNDLKADSIGILAYAGGGGQAIAGATRTNNVVQYTSPNWSGFTISAAYSTNAGAAGGTAGGEADIGSGYRKGGAWNLNPNMQGSNWQVGYSYWRSKPDNAQTIGAQALATSAAGGVLTAGSANNSADQRGDRLYGSYTWGGLKVGLAWDKSKLNSNLVATAGTRISDRTAWSLPIQYTWGPHTIGGHYDKARNDKATVVDDSAKMFAIGYSYDLSKRTSLGVTYARITNAAGGVYNLFTSSGSAALSIGSGSGAVAAGEDPRLYSVTMRHQF